MARAGKAPTTRRALVIGEGISGQAAALSLCRAGVPVLLLTAEPGDRAASRGLRDGIDAALGEGDDPNRHAEDLLTACDAQVDPLAVRALALAAPEIVEGLGRLGVPFARQRGDALALLRGPGASVARTAYAGSITARHVGRRLDALISGWERRAIDDGGAGSGDPWLLRLEGWVLRRLLVSEQGRAVGAVARQRRTGQVMAFSADGICLATGGFGGLWSGSSCGGDGSALGVAIDAGAKVEHAGRLAWSPLGYTAAGLTRALPEGLRALGARVSTPSDAGDGPPARRTLLDLSEIDRSSARAVAGDALAAWSTLTGLDPYSEPIEVHPTVSRSLGGLWVDFEVDGRGRAAPTARTHATSLPGLFAVGGAACQYHGARVALGGPLLAALLSGDVVGPAIAAYREGLEQSAFDASRRREEEAAEAERARLEARLDQASEGDGDSPHALRDELGALLSGGAGRQRSPEGAGGLRQELERFAERLRDARLRDTSRGFNQSAELLLALEDALPLARAVAEAVERDADLEQGQARG